MTCTCPELAIKKQPSSGEVNPAPAQSTVQFLINPQTILVKYIARGAPLITFTSTSSISLPFSQIIATYHALSTPLHMCTLLPEQRILSPVPPAVFVLVTV